MKLIAICVLSLGVTGCAANSLNLSNNYSSDNATSISGMVVDSEANKTLKSVPSYDTQCTERQVPVYANQYLKSTEVITAAIMSVVSPGSYAVATKNFNQITKDKFKEYANEKTIVAYKTIVDCKTKQSTNIKEVVNSYTITVRVGEEDLKFVTKEPHEIGSEVNVNVNRTIQ